jgi:hypothetical protein
MCFCYYCKCYKKNKCRPAIQLPSGIYFTGHSAHQRLIFFENNILHPTIRITTRAINKNIIKFIFLFTIVCIHKVTFFSFLKRFTMVKLNNIFCIAGLALQR